MLNKGYDRRQLVELFFPITARRRAKLEKNKVQKAEDNEVEESASTDYALSVSEFNDVLSVDLGVLLRFVYMLHVA